MMHRCELLIAKHVWLALVLVSFLGRCAAADLFVAALRLALPSF
jgi:hypothetical protein